MRLLTCLSILVAGISVVHQATSFQSGAFDDLLDEQDAAGTDPAAYARSNSAARAAAPRMSPTPAYQFFLSAGPGPSIHTRSWQTPCALRWAPLRPRGRLPACSSHLGKWLRNNTLWPPAASAYSISGCQHATSTTGASERDLLPPFQMATSPPWPHGRGDAAQKARGCAALVGGAGRKWETCASVPRRDVRNF
jgi:hypothetical protein